MPECVDLLERFGDRYRVTFDEAYSPRHVPRDCLDPWMMQLPCERGTIYPHGGELLAVEVDGRLVTAKAVAALPSVTLHQDGDHEKTFLFPVALFDRVAALVGPRRRRRLTEEQKTRLAGSMAPEERAAAAARGRATQAAERARAS